MMRQPFLSVPHKFGVVRFWGCMAAWVSPKPIQGAWSPSGPIANLVRFESGDSQPAMAHIGRITDRQQAMVGSAIKCACVSRGGDGELTRQVRVGNLFAFRITDCRRGRSQSFDGLSEPHP
jgi:hypothetical protein